MAHYKMEVWRVKTLVSQKPNCENALQWLAGISGVQVPVVGDPSRSTIDEQRALISVEEPSFQVEPISAEQLIGGMVGCFLTDLSAMGVRPREVRLNGKMKFRAIPLSCSDLSRLPTEARQTYQRIHALPSSVPFPDWAILEEVPPPAPPPLYRRDPWLAVQIGSRYYGVYHWD